MWGSREFRPAKKAVAYVENNPAVLLVGLLLLYVAFRGVKGAAKDAVNAVGGVASGVVVGVGEQFGIPETNKTQCQKDLDAGNMWDASFSCSAPDFARGVVKKVTGKKSAAATEDNPYNLMKVK